MKGPRSLTAVVGKLLAAGLAYTIGTLVAGTLLPALGLAVPDMPGTTSPGQQVVLVFLGGRRSGSARQRAGRALVAALGGSFPLCPSGQRGRHRARGQRLFDPRR